MVAPAGTPGKAIRPPPGEGAITGGATWLGDGTELAGADCAHADAVKTNQAASDRPNAPNTIFTDQTP